MPNDYEERLRRIEERLASLESKLGLKAAPTASPTPLPLVPAPPPTAPRPQTVQRPADSGSGLSATTILGWGGVAALVLAAAYLIRLAIDSGFLTPERQVGAAAVFGLGLIGAGLMLRGAYQRYGSLLPAGGIAILFLTVYGAHLYHKLIGPLPAAVGVVLICIGSLALREHYKNELYTLFAVAGSYTGPFFLHILAARPLDLVLYFAAWDILFCVYAIRTGWRSVYLLSAYLAFIIFDATWRAIDYTDWAWAAGFQAVQFLAFLGATVWFSLRHRVALKEHEAVLHLPPLLFFYATVYGLMARHIPDVAPWLALASIIPLAAAFALARTHLPEDARGGEQIVTTYAAIALFHAGYVELLPSGWRELAGLLAFAVLLWGSTQEGIIKRLWPLSLALGIVAFLSYARLCIAIDLREVVAWRVLIVVYAAGLYASYWFLRHRKSGPLSAGLMLYLGHLMAMAAPVHMSESRLVVSIVWGMLAVIALIVAIRTLDRQLGRSALMVFAGFAAKVILFDLSGAAPLVRIGSLLVLGVTMYAGGLLYRKIDLPKLPAAAGA